MKAKIVLVRPVYEENLGLVARAMANFGFEELALVKPECDWKSDKAKSRAMHGKSVLLKAKEFGSVSDAVKDCSYAIATSAKKGGKRNALSPAEIAKRFGKSNAKIAIVFGSEPSGLTNEERGECDFVASIPACEKYQTLNLSHAVCVMLYALYAQGGKVPVGKGSEGLGGKGKGFDDANPAAKRLLLRAFEKDLEMLSSIDDKKAVKAAFRALVGRSLLSEKEARALVAFLSETGKAMKGKGEKGN